MLHTTATIAVAKLYSMFRTSKMTVAVCMYVRQRHKEMHIPLV